MKVIHGAGQVLRQGREGSGKILRAEGGGEVRHFQDMSEIGLFDLNLFHRPLRVVVRWFPDLNTVFESTLNLNEREREMSRSRDPLGITSSTNPLCNESSFRSANVSHSSSSSSAGSLGVGSALRRDGGTYGSADGRVLLLLFVSFAGGTSTTSAG